MASPSPRRESHVNVNVNVNHVNVTHAETPEIRKYKKRFNSDILCAALWGVNLLIGTENGLMLLDRSGQGKVYQLISRRRFQQMEVLEGQNILVTVSGKKSRVRVYYLSWLKSKIIRTEQTDRKVGWVNVGDLEGAIHFKIGMWSFFLLFVSSLPNLSLRIISVLSLIHQSTGGISSPLPSFSSSVPSLCLSIQPRIYSESYPFPSSS